MMLDFLRPSPPTIRLWHVDMELAELTAVEPRTVHVLAAIDVQLDRRLTLCPARPAVVPVIPGHGVTRPSTSAGES